MAKRTQRPSVEIKTYEEAGRIVMEYEETRAYLTSIISSYVPDGGLIVDCSDFKNLKHYGRTIKGVAERMLRNHSVARNIIELKKTSDRAKRQELEERISIQLEGCRLMDSWVSELYGWAQNVYPHQA